MRFGELEDLRAIAKAWDVPAATAAWAIVADYISKAKGKKTDLGDQEVALRIATKILSRTANGYDKQPEEDQNSQEHHPD